MNRKNFVAKVATAFVALGMVLTFAGVAAMPANTAQAQTAQELQDQIQDLLATIAQLQAQISGEAASTCPALTQPLTIGSQGPSVVALQDYLTSTGHFTFSGGSTGYFGPITQQAVASWQAANGVSPTAGYWGPISLATYNSVCRPATPGDDDEDMDDDDDEDMSDGEEGSFIVTRGSASSAVVDLGDEEDIYSVEIEANDSDMSVERLDVNFNKRPWLYIDELMLEVEGETVAEMDLSSSNVTEITSTEWRVRFTGLDLLVEEDEEVEVTIWAITPDSLPGSRASDTVTVHVPDDGVRGVDEAGLIHYEPSGDLSTRSFTFDENFGLGELEARSNDDSPESGIIVVSSTTETEGVEVMVFDIKADDGSATLEEVYVEATTTTADADDIISELCLFQGSTEIECSTLTLATASISNRSVATGIVAGEYYALFDDLELEMDNDEELTFTIEASLNEADGTNYSAGDTIDLTLEQVGGYNSDFEDTADAATLESDEVFTLLTEGIFLAADEDDHSATVSQIGETAEERGSFSFKFDVTAVEEDVWIHQNVATSATSGAKYVVTGDSFSGTTTTNLSCSGCSTTGSTFFKVSDGNTERFTMTVVLNPSSDGIYGIELDSVFFDTDAALGTSDTEVTAPDTQDFETDDVFIAG